MKIKKLGALLVSAALCAGMAAPAFAYGGEPVEEVEQPVLTSTTDEEDVVTVTDETSGALTPEGNLTLVDDYYTNYSDGSGQQFITLVSKSGNTFYLVIDRNAKGQQTVHFMNLVDEADLLSLMEDEDAEAYTAEKEAAAQAAQERKQAEEDAKKAAEEAEASGSEQTGGNKVTKYAATFLGVLALVGLVAGGGIYTFMKQKQKKQAEKEAAGKGAAESYKPHRPASYLRKSFTASKGEARLYITAKGLYAAWLDGKRIGDMVLAPGSFTGNKHLGAQTYDVTALLHEGENELLIALGDGWHRSTGGVDGDRDLFGDTLLSLIHI